MIIFYLSYAFPINTTQKCKKCYYKNPCFPSWLMNAFPPRSLGLKLGLERSINIYCCVKNNIFLRQCPKSLLQWIVLTAVFLMRFWWGQRPFLQRRKHWCFHLDYTKRSNICCFLQISLQLIPDYSLHLKNDPSPSEGLQRPSEPKHYPSSSSPASPHYLVISVSPGGVACQEDACLTNGHHDQVKPTIPQKEIPLTG